MDWKSVGNWISDTLVKVDDFVWGPVMLVLLVGTGIFLTIRLKFRPWRNLGFAIKSTLSKEARTTKRRCIPFFSANNGSCGNNRNR